MIRVVSNAQCSILPAAEGIGCRRRSNVLYTILFMERILTFPPIQQLVVKSRVHPHWRSLLKKQNTVHLIHNSVIFNKYDPPRSIEQFGTNKVQFLKI